MRERSGWRRPLAGLVLVLAGALAGNASAATIGHNGLGTGCAGGDVLADSGYVVPAGGGIVSSFRFLTQALNAGQQLDFLVLRPTGADSYTVVGRTGLVTLAGTGLETFPASVQSRAGDVLGFYVSTQVDNCLYVGSGTSAFRFQPDPATGATVTLDPFLGHDLNESATVVTTGLTVSCGPPSVRVGQSVTCNATYTGYSHPTGTVTFASNSSGTFNPVTCTLVLIGGNQARCSTTYTPRAVGTGTHKIYANYSGDALNPAAHTSTTLTVHL